MPEVEADQAFRIFTPPQYILQRSLAERRSRLAQILHAHNLEQLFIFYDGV